MAETSQKFNVNTATDNELIHVVGIDEEIVDHIIKYRRTVGKFNTLEDLKKIKGFDQKLLDKVKDQLMT